jgi:1,4-dihydroxy-2-naphthoyl-CoA synthase
MDALIDEMTVLSAQLFAGDEAAEGMAAFAERREPSWAESETSVERPAS